MPSETMVRRLTSPLTECRTSSRRESVIHSIFADQAAATPDAVAAAWDGGCLTYSELNERANSLARRLGRLGVGRGTFVGLCLERSPDVVVGMLAILKAGGAYVPLDPSYPDDRLAYMLRDTAAPVVLAHEDTADRLGPLGHLTQVVRVDRDAGEPGGDLPGDATADDLAYVMYTSGSTGRPKGVQVGHRAVVRLVRDTDYCEFGPGEVYLHHSPLSFDASTFEIWGSLLNGGRLALLPPGPPTPDGLAAAIRRHGVTTLWLTAGLFHLVVDQQPAALAPLRQLLAGGDVLSPSHVRRALAALDNGVVINGYGPTESTTFACCHRMPKGTDPGESVPIGRPIANTTAHVLDENLRPVPDGTPGELFIGGDGLAHGYLNLPELTREKFIADPFGPDSGARLYRTGDRVRRRSDGVFEFLGRLDDQVKIRGHRIEPGEIAEVLRGHPNVRQCAVVACDDGRGEKQLVAYVVAGNPASGTEFKDYLADRLPAYLVPAHVEVVAALPLTPNGKIDRSALPPPGRPLATPGGATPPATDVEARVAALCERVLRHPVGVEDNFFDLGATSLNLIELHSEITRAFRQELPVTELFRHPTVRALGRRLAGQADAAGAIDDAQSRARRQREALGRRPIPGKRP